MANSKIVWVGQTANLRIDQIQPATIANKHISKYVFYSAYVGLTGVGELTASSTVVNAHDPVSSEKIYPITSYLLYSHKFADGTAFATSNKVITELTVRQPLNETSLTAVAPVPNEGVWSNANNAVFHITPTFSDQYPPYSKACYLISDSTTESAACGSIQNIHSEALSEGVDIGWSKTTGTSTDLGTESKNITISVQSVKNESAATTRTIDGRRVTFLVKNAVTGLGGLENKTLYAGSSVVAVPVTFTPAKPYSKALLLVDKDGNVVSSNSITSTGNATVSLDGQTIKFDASKVTTGTATQTIKFKVRSWQSAMAIDTEFITFTVNRVDNITRNIVEGQTISVSPGIGTIHTATITKGNTAISISKSGETLSITGLGVDNDTPWSITVTNAAGAHITVSGTTTHLTDVSTSINTGDFIVIGTDFIGGLGASITEIITKLQPDKGTASLEAGKLKYEAYTANGPITAGTYAIKVKGANGATRTVNITVSNITATLS